MEPDGNSSVALTPAWHSIGARAFPAPAWHYGKTSTPQGIPNTDGIDYSQRGAVVVVEGRPSQPLSREPSPCSSSAFFSTSSGSASSAGHCSRSQPTHCRSSSYVAGHIRKIMWRAAICGARAESVSVEHGCDLLTPHIFMWMIAVHHHDGGSIMHDELFKVPTVVARYRAGPY